MNYLPKLALCLALVAPAAIGDGNIEAGKAKAAVCAACHGADGKGLTPEWPNLAGQVPGYIATQLKAFKSKERDNAIMGAQVLALSEEDMANLDAYYASLPPVIGAVSEKDADEARGGEKLYRGGVQETQIPACMSCHGPGATGLKPLYPRLAGQKAKYVELSLLAFKDGVRKSDIMGPIAFKLSKEQIRQVALFVSGL